MLTLSLLRHAKSSWKDPNLADHERPLNTRGMAEAPLMGKATARRTRDTLALVLPELKTEPKVIYEDGLYHGKPAEILGIMHEVGAGAGRVLLVGHNPEPQEFA